MKNKIILFVLLFAFAGGAFAFVNTINYPPIANNMYGLNFILDGPGSYSFIGRYYNSGTSLYDGFVARIDPLGNSITINTTPDYKFYDGTNTANGYAVLAMFTDGSSNDSAELLKLDATGNCISVRTISDAYFYSAALCATAGNAIILSIDDYGPSGNQMLVGKYDAAGDCVWAYAYNYNPTIYKVAPASDGGYFIAGNLSGYPFIMKVDSVGNWLWNWQDALKGEIYHVLGTENGSVIAAGYKSDAVNDNVLAVKIDNMGNAAWRKEFDMGGSYEYGLQINPAAGEKFGYVLSGSSMGFTGDVDYRIFALQVDGQGNTRNLKSIPASMEVGYGYNAALSADRFMLLGIDANYGIFTADYTAVAYASKPVTGGRSSDNFYACPQPAKDFVRFVYALEDRATVKINIYNFANRLVGQNVSDEIPADNVTTEVDTSKLSSGVYFYQIIQEVSGKAAKRLKTGEFIIKK